MKLKILIVALLVIAGGAGYVVHQQDVEAHRHVAAVAAQRAYDHWVAQKPVSVGHASYGQFGPSTAPTAK